MNLQALECSKDWPQTWEQVFVSVNSDVEARWPFTVTMICPKNLENRDFVSVWVEPVKLTQVETFFPLLRVILFFSFLDSTDFALLLLERLFCFSRSKIVFKASNFDFKCILLQKSENCAFVESHTDLKQSLRFVKKIAAIKIGNELTLLF